MKRSRYVAGIVAVCVVLALSDIAGEALMKAANGAWTTAARRATPAPTAALTAKPTSGVAPLAVHFTSSSAGSPTAWFWDFGDGATATVQNPSHTYSVPGIYTVSLLTSSATGSHTTTKTGYITVNATPNASAWTTILDDEFNTPGVPSHWSLYYGSYGDIAHNCAAPSQVQVPGDGYLHLKMQYLTKGVCGAGWYTGGMQVNAAYGGVDQAITVRWRIVPSADPSVVRSHHIIPMRWVDDPHYPWYRGESNYCEGGYPGGCYTYLHYGPNSRQVTHSYTVDLTKWHTWRVEVRNHQVSIFIDNMTKPVWVYKGNETTTPNSFKRTVLQQECPLSGCPPAAYAGDVEDVQIDWIKIENATNVKANAQAGSSQAQTANIAQTASGCSSAMTDVCPADVSATRMTTISLLSDIAPTADTPRRFTFEAIWMPAALDIPRGKLTLSHRLL